MLLAPCASCHRHIHADEASCPFCGQAPRTTRSPSLLDALQSAALAGTLALMTVSGCIDKDPGGGDDAGSTTTNGTNDTSDTTADSTGDTATEGMSSTDTDSSTSDTTSAGGSFYAGPNDLPSEPGTCDPIAQDCPEGEKCVPYANGGSVWNADKCVPVLGDKGPGEECVLDGVMEGTDNCGSDSYCWAFEADDNIGTCMQFCTGTFDEPLCPEGAACIIANDNVIALCLPTCDPLDPVCADGEVCTWTGEAFQCIFAGDELPTNEPCAFLNVCAPGNVCVQAESLPSCADAACCAAFCDLTDPICEVPGTECVPWFDPDPPPAGYENLGACLLPG